MIADSALALAAIFARRSSRSTSPFSRQATTTTRMPANAAEAALVPWALDGIRHTSRPESPRSMWYWRMASRPAYSPCDPALGCRLTLSYPVIPASQPSRSAIRVRSPRESPAGANGCSAANCGQVMGSISAAAFSFMVHDPSGIMLRSNAMSLSDSARRYRIISVSLW
ncbi:Uncharacterised protein [Mycobacteroides abscessus subsp. abscessus]|nr:Uncharacterised protein [Mycobacteroides abscessus subsp. abscessus]